MEELDDDTLIALIKDGDTHAEALLCAKYWVFARNFGRKFAVLYKDLGFNADDFMAAAFSSVVIAMEKYSPAKHKSFHNYWMVVARNQCINFVHDNSFIDFETGRPISFDAVSYEDGLSLHETTGLPDPTLTYGITRKQLYDFIVSKDSKLSENERLVAYYMFLQEYSYEDIQMLTKWKKNKVYAIVRRARLKVSNFFKSGYFNN